MSKYLVQVPDTFGTLPYKGDFSFYRRDNKSNYTVGVFLMNFCVIAVRNYSLCQYTIQ